MPPKKDIPPDFLLTRDGMHLKCLLCPSAPLLEHRSAWRHVRESKSHLASVKVKASQRKMEHLRRLAAARSAAETMIAISRASTVRSSALNCATLPGASMHTDSSQSAGTPTLAVVDEMLEDYRFDPADFLMHLPEESADAERRLLAESWKTFGLWNPEHAAHDFGGTNSIGEAIWDKSDNPADDTDDTVTNVLQNLRILTDFDADDAQRMTFTDLPLPDPKATWFPYTTKLIFLLDILDNLGRNRISDSLMQVFLWVLKEAGVHDVPSLYAFRQFQKSLRKCTGIPTHQSKSAHGNVFFMNDLATIVAKDYTTALVRPHMRFYPEIPDGPITEVWHAEKWRKDMDLSMLTPMYVEPGGIPEQRQHYYVGELALLKSGDLVIPIRWVMYKGKLYADACPVKHDHRTGTAQIIDAANAVVFVPADALTTNFENLQRAGKIPHFHGKDRSTLAQMPNRLRKLAGGEPLYTSFIDLFADDVSGNRSKSWNKHWNLYFSHRNLPRRLLQQEFHVHFLSTSTHATALEQIGAVKLMMEETQKQPVRVRDALTGEHARFRLHLHAEPSDNPMQGEESGHMSGNSNCLCRKCKAGGTQEEKGQDEVYDSLFKTGEPRTSQQTLQCIVQQVSKACSGIAVRVSELQTASGVKDAYTEPWIQQLIQRARELKSQNSGLSTEAIHNQLMDWVAENHVQVFNPNLRIKGFDANKDTPIELLHTILLGVIKYVWYNTWSTWNPESKKTYALRLQATDINGLSIPPICANYIMQYANSLIGRQLKTVGQTTVFHVYDLVNPVLFNLWKSAGILMALLWIPEIDDMDQYV
ncbi:hypothetical protein EVG20_g10686, partial [Dentipellis fragilis]